MDFQNEFQDGIPFIMEGQVMATNDPDQMGRVKVWIPSLDGENFEIDQLPWAEYASPFGGFTVEYPAGGGNTNNSSHVGYGFWAIPKIGSTVMIFCLNANPSSRFYFAASVRLHRNRALPAGRNSDFNGNPGPFGDDGDETGALSSIQPAFNNLREQFQGKITSSIAKTRGAWERSVAQGKLEKNGDDGYAKSPVDDFLDPQTYCIVTPGRHAIIMQDDPKGSRIRFKTAEGHQIIFDDTNERIYMSTAKGKSWVELDQDGHIHIFGGDSISIRSGKDINLFADRDINLEASQNINMKATGVKSGGKINLGASNNINIRSGSSIFQSSCENFHINSDGLLKMTSSNNMDIRTDAALAVTGSSSIDIRAGGDIKQTGANIHLNGPVAKIAEQASCAAMPESPSIVPGHEPWEGRPDATSPYKRGPNWKA